MNYTHQLSLVFVALGLAMNARAGDVLIDFDSGVGPLTYSLSGAGTISAVGGRAEVSASTVTLLEDSGAFQESGGAVSATMVLQSAVDAQNPVGLIMVNANDTTEQVTALASDDGTVSLVDWIGNFQNVQFFAPNATDNTMTLEYDVNTERATLTVDAGTIYEDSVQIDAALNGALQVGVGVAANGPGGFESFEASGPGLLDFPPLASDPEVSGTSGQGFTEEGDDLSLGVDVTGGTPPFTFQWMKNDAPVSDGGRISGATTDTLNIADTQPGDTGTYQLEFFDSAKAGPFLSPPIGVLIVPVGSLPAAGFVGLAIAVAVLAGFGALRLRR